MTYASPGVQALDYLPCRYGRSRLIFRGPRRTLAGRYVAVLGGTETYGRFVGRPFCDLLQDATGVEVVNFGCLNAGLDAFLNEPAIFDLCAGAELTVVQVPAAHNLTNRYYAVHPRRNDRFLRASALLRTIYPEVDFTEVHFTRHLISRLAEASERKFALVRGELQEAWTARMKLFLARLQGPKALLWLSDHGPDTPESGVPPLGGDPLFVDRGMLEALRPAVRDIVEIVASAGDIAAGREEMLYSELEAPVAQEILGPVVHRRAAEALAGLVRAAG